MLATNQVSDIIKTGKCKCKCIRIIIDLINVFGAAASASMCAMRVPFTGCDRQTAVARTNYSPARQAYAMPHAPCPIHPDPLCLLCGGELVSFVGNMV